MGARVVDRLIRLADGGQTQGSEAQLIREATWVGARRRRVPGTHAQPGSGTSSLREMKPDPTARTDASPIQRSGRAGLLPPS
jgi:hypothetical protein